MATDDHPSTPETLLVPVTVYVRVNVEDYRLNYGHADDVEQYTRVTVRAAAQDMFDRLEWATVEDGPE